MVNLAGILENMAWEDLPETERQNVLLRAALTEAVAEIRRININYERLDKLEGVLVRCGA